MLNRDALHLPHCVFQIMRRETVDHASCFIPAVGRVICTKWPCLLWFVSDHQDHNECIAVVLCQSVLQRLGARRRRTSKPPLSL